MSPTEYRMIAKRAQLSQLPNLRRAVAAGEALDSDTQAAWLESAGVQVIDGYGQTETGHLTGTPPGESSPRGSMGRSLPGVKLWIEDGELVLDPRSVPTFFRGYLGEEPINLDEPWRTGDEVKKDGEGFLHFVGRTDDVIISSGYRIGPAEVESVLMEHPAVAEAAVVGAPDLERGSVVRAIVVLRDGSAATDKLKSELQQHVQAVTAPYKYPRIVDFVEGLPRTASGKVIRSDLRASPPLSANSARSSPQ